MNGTCPLFTRNLSPVHAGEHYYLTEEQNGYLSDKIWGNGGVPSYAIFNADGNLLYRQVGWAGLDKIKPEIENALE